MEKLFLFCRCGRFRLTELQKNKLICQVITHKLANQLYIRSSRYANGNLFRFVLQSEDPLEPNQAWQVQKGIAI